MPFIKPEFVSAFKKMENLSPKWMKVLKTCNLYCCFFVLGLCISVPGPCLLDLQNMVHTDTERIAFIYTARSIGYLIGSILGGILLDATRSKQVVMAVCNFFMATTMLLIPWSTNLAMLTACMVVNGLALGTVNTGGNVVCLSLWGGDSGPFYQALHFTFGLGGLAAPLIAAPFLGDYSEEVYLYTGMDNATDLDNFSNFTFHSVVNTKPNNIIYPFSIIGGFGQLVTLMFILACLISPVEEREAENKTSQNSNVGLGFLTSIIILNFLLLFVETGTEIGYAQMLTTYVVKGRLKLSPSTGSFMTSTFWTAFTLSRLATVFLAIKISSFTLILFDLVISLMGSFILLFLASHEWSIWAASALLGMGIASFFPATVAWLDTYINVTNKIASVFVVGCAFGEMLIPFTISYFMKTFPDVLIYLVPSSCVSSTLIVFVLYFISRKRQKKSTGNVIQKAKCLNNEKMSSLKPESLNNTKTMSLKPKSKELGSFYEPPEMSILNIYGLIP